MLNLFRIVDFNRIQDYVAVESYAGLKSDTYKIIYI